MLIALFIGVSAYFTALSKNEDVQQQVLYYEHYIGSTQFTVDLNHFMRAVVYAKLFYENEDNIKSKKAVFKDKDELEFRKDKVFEKYLNSNDIEDIVETFKGEDDYTDQVYENTQELKITREEYFAKFPEQETEIINSMIREQLLDLKDCEREIENNKIFEYEVIDKDSDIEYLKIRYEKYPFFLYVTEDDINSSNEYIRDGLVESTKGTSKLNQDKALFVGINQTIYNKLENDWQHSRQELTEIAIPVVMFIVMAFLLMVYLIIVTGYRLGEDKVYLYPFDKVYSEIQILILITAVITYIGLVTIRLDDDSPYAVAAANETVFCLGYTIAVAATVLTAFCMLLTQVRKIKAKKYRQSFFTIRLFNKFFDLFKTVWENEKISKKVIVLSIILPLLCATWVGVPFVIILLIILINKYMGDFKEICEGAKIIRSGDLNYHINVEKNGELGKLADDINQISQGLEKAVSNETRSERLKAELISNVSHDLKTPLTSIITYVDLLKQEEINNETAKDYIEVIDRKARRLTELTNDLFEAAKASSGAMPVEIEKIDWNAIIRQGLGEFDEKLNNASLEMKVSLLENPAYIMADGRLLWRVLDNLLGNVVKYALEKSRVYINLEEEETKIHFTMKNISAYELNIPADELIERFKRGDESRNSEGSGLGLSIANSLVDLQKGLFEISIDGDLFRVDIWMPKWRKQTHE